VGISFGSPTKFISAGAQHGDQFSLTHGKTDMLDVTGDRLPDMVYKDSGDFFFCENLGTPEGGTPKFAAPKQMQMPDGLSDFHYVVLLNFVISYLYFPHVNFASSTGVWLAVQYWRVCICRWNNWRGCDACY
jgi:hypothetical protein